MTEQLSSHEQLAKLDGLFGHLSSCTGLYSKETFLSLYSCITRMIRNNRMRGFIMTRTLGDEGFGAASLALDSLPEVPLFRLDDHNHGLSEAGITPETGFLIALTDRFCATLYWSAETNQTFRMYEGGWTFHPADSKTVAGHLIEHLQNPTLKLLWEETSVDRRYDDKLNVLITALVNGLENRNRELTLALEKVNHLSKKMVESERLAAIGQLCSVIAHEIRNPLGLIDLYAKLTEGQLQKWLDEQARQEQPSASPMSAPPETLLKNLSLIREATQNLETILSELTDYSRPLQLQLERVRVISLVRDVCEFYAPYYQEKGIRLVIPDDPGKKETLEIDSGRIRQALLNLLKNALEASVPETTVAVSVASRKGDRNIYIKVADQGKGIEKSVAAKLFTPYFSTKGNGTGLGLAHSRKILQAHGGNVELLTSGPQGTTFALILPKNREYDGKEETGSWTVI